MEQFGNQGRAIFLRDIEQQGTYVRDLSEFRQRKVPAPHGIYTLEYDENEGNTITGLYDHASGFWNHIYRIDRFTEESMTWIVKDDLSDISVYTRCEAVPDDILNGTRAAL